MALGGEGMPTSKPFDLSYVGPCMEEWRRLSGLPPERAEVSPLGGPGLEEIAERQAQEHAQLKREIAERIHAATVKIPPQRKGRRPDDWMKEAVRASGVSCAPVPVPDQCPRVGERVLVRIPDGLTAHGMQGGGVYQGIVESTEGDLARVRVPDIGRLITLSVSHLIREGVEAIPADRAPATVPHIFQVGDRVRAARDDGRGIYVGAVGMVVELLRTYRPGRGDTDAARVQLHNGPCTLFYLTDLELVEARTSPREKTKAEAYRECPCPNANGDAFSMLPVWIDTTAMPLATWAATLELAGGRLMDIPGPDPAVWEEVEEHRWDAEENMRVRMRTETKVSDVEMRCFSPGRNGGGIYLLGHDAARCWAHDMARIVNEQGPVGVDPQVRGALLRSLRSYRRRPPVDPHADRAYPTLRAYLW